MRYLSLALALLLTFFQSGETFGRTDAQSLAHLDTRLEHIKQDARLRRLVGGGVLLGLGAAMGVGAAISASSPDPLIRSRDPITFGIMGGILALGGTIALAFPTSFERWPSEFQSLPATTPEQVTLKVVRGEVSLSELADRARLQRRIGGATLLTISGALFVWYGVTNDTTLSNRTFLLYEGFVLAGLGMLPLFFESTAEIEARRYREWKSGTTGASLDWFLAPIQNGVAGYLSARF